MSNQPPTTLDLSSDVVALTVQLVDFPSQSHHEGPLADAVTAALEAVPHLDVTRRGNTVVARTQFGCSERVLIGGHLDTVPVNANLPHRLDGDLLYGLGACDMKGGVAIALTLAAELNTAIRDVTYVFYECEEVESVHNGLQHLVDAAPQLLQCDLAILMEPSNAQIEAGCQGTLRAQVSTSGRRAHSARPWMGDNAIHAVAPILDILYAYQPLQPIVDGLQYRESLSAVAISGGVAGNVIPDACQVTVNFRYAPDRSAEQAVAHMCELFAGYDVQVVDNAMGARPGLELEAAREFIAATGAVPSAKFGWTDVARFAQMGTPALNFGPGNPSVAHMQDEVVSVEQIRSCHTALRSWLRPACSPERPARA